MRRSRPVRAGFAAALATLLTTAGLAAPSGAADGTLTSAPAQLVLDISAPAGSSIKPIISSGERLPSGFLFEGIPDGIGAMPGSQSGTVDVFVNHEQSHVPFPPNLADVEDSSVSRLTLDAATGAVLSGRVGRRLKTGAPRPRANLRAACRERPARVSLPSSTSGR